MSGVARSDFNGKWDKDMEAENKVVAAISAAVYQYMVTEEEMLAEVPAEVPVTVPQPVQLPSLWGLTGREGMMRMRQLMQLRGFRKVG